MQVVVTEVCASLIFPCADGLAANPAVANTTSRVVVQPRMIAFPVPSPATIDDGGGALNRPGWLEKRDPDLCLGRVGAQGSRFNTAGSTKHWMRWRNTQL
jgi:hypothetical protein